VILVDLDALGAAVLSWLLTYAIHSTILWAPRRQSPRGSSMSTRGWTGYGRPLSSAHS